MKSERDPSHATPQSDSDLLGEFEDTVKRIGAGDLAYDPCHSYDLADAKKLRDELLRRLSARSESAPIPEAPRYVGGFCQDREMCMEEAKRLRSLIPGCDCDNYVQCWEPCGRLGHSAKHARVVPEEKP